MQSASPLKSIVAAAALLCAAVSSAVPPEASADAYLDALNDAASGVEVDAATEITIDSDKEVLKETERQAASSSASTTPAAVKVAGNMPAGLDLAGLESFLKQSYIGSYAFFKRLADEQKQAVFSAYQSRPDIDYLRAQIKEQYRKR